jgi:hypothetical protein
MGSGRRSRSGRERPPPNRTKVSHVIEKRARWLRYGKQAVTHPLGSLAHWALPPATPVFEPTFTEFEITRICFHGMRSLSDPITAGADFCRRNTGA